jgi:hypothetical protein
MTTLTAIKDVCLLVLCALAQMVIGKRKDTR